MKKPVTVLPGDLKDAAESPYMQQAIEEGFAGISNQEGGPFGAVIVRDGEIIGRGHNRVISRQDATCHGEMEAIRDASRNLGTHDLSGCKLYTTGESCTMCLFACLWTNIGAVYYGCTISDNAEIGFRDEAFDQLAGGREHFQDYLIQTDRQACLKLYKYYRESEHEQY